MFTVDVKQQPNSPVKFCCYTSFTLSKQSHRSRSALFDAYRFLGLFCKEKSLSYNQRNMVKLGFRFWCRQRQWWLKICIKFCGLVFYDSTQPDETLHSMEFLFPLEMQHLMTERILVLYTCMYYVLEIFLV